MNATALPDVIQVADYHNGSDSDTNIDDDDASAVEFYQPVSAVDSEDDEDQIGNDVVLIHSQLHSNDVTVNQVDGGISSLQLNDDVGRNDRLNKSSDNEAEAKEVEEEVASDSEIIRAFREDENRINAPLTAKNAKRVREAMRGISFAEAPPHWAGLIPENNWMDRLRGLRQSSSRRGIGSEISKQLAAHGVTVILTSRDHSVGLEAAKVFQEGGLNVFCHQLDVLDTASIIEFCDWLKENYGGLDILINNAAVNFNQGSDNTVEYASQVITTNYYGTKNMIQAMIPLMKPSAAGARIVNVSSRLGRINGRRNKIDDVILREKFSNLDRVTEELIDQTVSSFLQQVQDGTWESGGWPKTFTDYSVSKLAVNTYTRLVAKMLSDRPEGQKIYINCYCPGWVKTAMTGYAGNISAEEGADTAVWLALLPDLAITGKFFAERREISF